MLLPILKLKCEVFVKVITFSGWSFPLWA